MIPVKTYTGTDTNMHKGRAAGQIARETTEPTPLGTVVKKEKKKSTVSFLQLRPPVTSIQPNVSWVARHPAQWSSVFCVHNVSL